MLHPNFQKKNHQQHITVIRCLRKYTEITVSVEYFLQYKV